MVRVLAIAGVLLIFLIGHQANGQGKPEAQKAPPGPKAEQGTPAQKFPLPFFGAPQSQKTGKLLKISLQPKSVLKPDKSVTIEVAVRVENLSPKVFKDAKLTVGLLAINRKIDFEKTSFIGPGEDGPIDRKGSFERKISRLGGSAVENFKVLIETPPNTKQEGLQLAVMGAVEAKAEGETEPTLAHSLVSIKDFKSEN